MRISSVVDCLRMDGRGAHSVVGNGGGRVHGLASLCKLKNVQCIFNGFQFGWLF